MLYLYILAGTGSVCCFPPFYFLWCSLKLLRCFYYFLMQNVHVVSYLSLSSVLANHKITLYFHTQAIISHNLPAFLSLWNRRVIRNLIIFWGEEKLLNFVTLWRMLYVLYVMSYVLYVFFFLFSWSIFGIFTPLKYAINPYVEQMSKGIIR